MFLDVQCELNFVLYFYSSQCLFCIWDDAMSLHPENADFEIEVPAFQLVLLS